MSVVTPRPPEPVVTADARPPAAWSGLASPTTTDEVRSVARELLAKYAAHATPEPAYVGVVGHALRTLFCAYQGASPETRPGIAQDADRLIGMARAAGTLPASGQSFTEWVRRAPGAAPRPAPTALPESAAKPVPAAVPARVSPQVVYDATPVNQPPGTGTNAGTQGLQFQGVTAGTTGRPRNWFDVPKPGAYVSAGVSAAGVSALDGRYVDIVSPRATVIAGASNGTQAVQMRAMRDMEAGPDGDNDWRLGASFISKTPNWETRVDTQVGSADPLPGATADSGNGVAWSLHATQFAQLDPANRLRARFTAAHSGRDRERVGLGASLFLNPLPDAGYFPAYKDSRVGGGVDFQRTPIPALTDPGRVRETLTASVHVANNRFRLAAALSHATTQPLAGAGSDPVTATRIALDGQMRLSRQDKGQPPTDQRGISSDAPNGLFGSNERGARNTTLYGSVSHTLSTDAPAPATRPPFATGDAAKLGVITASDIGVVSSAGVEIQADLDHGDLGAKAWINLQPSEALPVYVSLEGQANPDRTAVAASVVVTPSDYSYLKLGAERVIHSRVPGEEAGDTRLLFRAGVKY